MSKDLTCVCSPSLSRRRGKFTAFHYLLTYYAEHVHLLVFPRNETYSVEILFSCKRSTSAGQDWLCIMSKDWLDRLSIGPEKKVVRFWQAGGGFDKNIDKLEGIESVIDIFITIR